MKNKILQIMYKLSKGEIKYNLASKQVLDLFDDNQQQRELLIAYELKLWINPTKEQIEIAEKTVDMYLSN